MRIYYFLLIVILLFSGKTWARPESSHELATKNLKSPHQWNGITFSGYIDTSYNYLLRKNVFISNTENRLYDIEPNGFTLQQAALFIAKQPDQGLGAFINPLIGRDANKIAFYGWDPYFGSQTLALDFPQLFLQYAIDNFTFVGGRLLALAGIESYDSAHVANFSRSILDGYAQPGGVFGLRAKYKVNETWHILAGVNDGWDSIRDWTRPKTLEFGVGYNPHPTLKMSAQIYSGGERLIIRTATGPIGRRNFIDVIATLDATTKLTLAANYDYGMQTKAALPFNQIGPAKWQGIAAYLYYRFTEKYHGTLRGEIFSDTDGYMTGVAQSWQEATLTFAYKPIKSLEFRAETRHDFSNVNSFVSTSGRRPRNNQQSYALEGLYLL